MVTRGSRSRSRAGHRRCRSRKCARSCDGAASHRPTATEPEEGATKVYGVAVGQADKESAILAAGNVEGVSGVDDRMTVSVAAPAAQFYAVVEGDTLSKIAKQYCGDANEYPRIFEANKPMLKDPDKTYPGQNLRIPPK